MVSKEVVLYAIIAVIIAAIGFLGLNSFISKSQATNAYQEVSGKILEITGYKGSTTPLNTYNGVTIDKIGFKSSTVAIADNANYLSAEVIATDADGEITVADTTYTGIVMLSDDTTTEATLGGGVPVVALDTVPGIFFTVVEGDGTNGGADNEAVVRIGYGQGADNAEIRSNFEQKFNSFGKGFTVINGTDKADGALTIVMNPSY